MKVEYNGESQPTVDGLRSGETFLSEGELYIKTDECKEDMIRVVRVHDGMIRYFVEGKEVLAVKYKAVPDI
jgi:hypothetical protein